MKVTDLEQRGVRTWYTLPKAGCAYRQVTKGYRNIFTVALLSCQLQDGTEEESRKSRGKCLLRKRGQQHSSDSLAQWRPKDSKMFHVLHVNLSVSWLAEQTLPSAGISVAFCCTAGGHWQCV